MMKLKVWYKHCKFVNSIVDIILRYAVWPMRLNDAKQYRKELMDERKYFVDNNTQLVFERKFSLCEH